MILIYKHDKNGFKMGSEGQSGISSHIVEIITYISGYLAFLLPALKRNSAATCNCKNCARVLCASSKLYSVAITVFFYPISRHVI